MNYPKCPYCGNDLDWQVFTDIMKTSDNGISAEVLASCKKCDYDAIFELVVNLDKTISFENERRYFFG